MKRTCITRLRNMLAGMTALCAMTALHSCDNAIFDGEGDCSVRYHVSFTYDMNMKFANAFAHEVKSLTLYVYDTSGNLVTSKTESGEALAQPDYTMDIDVAPGKYNLLVWAYGESPVENSISYSVAQTGPLSTMGASFAVTDNEGARTVSQDIVPLYHGILNAEFPDTYGDVVIGPVSLTKDTNLFKVLLQNINGSVIAKHDFSFSIVADNNELNYLNNVVSTNPFSYTPWATTLTSASFDTPESSTTSRTQTSANGLLAEMTTGRLMADRTPYLVVHRNSDDHEVIRINLIQYLLMVKGEYNKAMSNQEYLDRMDSFTLMFFIDVDHTWAISAGVFINGWRVVPPQDVDM